MNRKLLPLLLLPALLVLPSCKGGGTGDDRLPEPYIESISTAYEGNKVVAGQPVTLNGINFSPVVSDNKVVYGVGLDQTAISVNEASEDHVVFTAPTVEQNQLKIRVSVKGKDSNAVTLVYTEAPGPDEPWDDTPTIDLPGATTVTLCEGVEWTLFHGTWEGQVRNINIVRTRLNGHNHLGMYYNYSDESLLYLDQKCEYMDAVAGTNGPMACCQFARVNGEVKHGPTETSEWVANCAMTIDGDAVDIVMVKDNYKAARLTNAPDGTTTTPPANTLTVGCAGPLLVWNGVIQNATSAWLAADKDKWLTTTHPRTAIGLSKDGKTIVQVAVDGRWTSSDTDKRAIGMSTDLLAKLMRGLGCYKAMNFDGGGGTQMWVYGHGDIHHIVNHPHNSWPVYGTTPESYYWIKDNEVARRTTGNAVYVRSDLK